MGRVEAVRYHSLHVVLNGDEPLQPLAWADDGEENGKVLMAVKHVVKPFWAVQYHPESVRTEGGGEQVIRNFWRLADFWSNVHAREVQPWSAQAESRIGAPWPRIHSLTSSRGSTPSSTTSACGRRVSTRVIEDADLDIPAVCESLGVDDESTDFVLLESAAQPGRFTIIASLNSDNPKITYRVGDPEVCITTGTDKLWGDVEDDIWTWLSTYMHDRRAFGGDMDVPFWGGFVGFLSYELGVQTLSPALSRDEDHRGQHPDVNLVFVERSIVLDSMTGRAFVQSTVADDDKWLSGMVLQLRHLLTTTTPHVEFHPCSQPKRRRKTITTSPTVLLPDKQQYIESIKHAQQYLFAGDSYELCLTAPTRVRVPEVPSDEREGSSSWQLYKVLRKRNPAPHSAFLRLHPSTLLGSSPERFLSYSRPPHGVCQLRPIKGTVRKGPGVTREVAEQALIGSVKEVAENLMIVDLIRHDLHGVVGDDVKVKQFCGVEEYETVWQLVSVIEGRLPRDTEADSGCNLGWEVLRHSLPPGNVSATLP